MAARPACFGAFMGFSGWCGKPSILRLGPPRLSRNGHVEFLDSFLSQTEKRRVMKMQHWILAAALLPGIGAAADITGAGATFPYPIYAKLADAYKKQTSVGLKYQSIGSG